MRLRLCSLLLLVAAACADGGRATSSDPAGPACGNGRLEAGEQCDGTALGGDSCVSLGFGAGTLGCGPSCRFDLAGCGAPASCGNGSLEAPERCDSSRTSTVTCVDLGYGAGSLSCLANCAAFDPSACGAIPSCGNGSLEAPERCDGTRFGGAASCAAPARRVCSADCREVTCALPVDAGMSAPSDAGPAGDATVTPPGADAAVDPCAGVTCSGHGLCAVAGGSALCVCDPRYMASGLSCVPVPTGAPSVTLTVSPTALGPFERATFQATVTDPDGLADVLGGELRAPTGEVYGAFTRAGAGTFTLERSWNQLNNVRPIQGGPGDSLAFEAVFFDASSNMGTGRATAPMVCQNPASDYLICNGECVSDRDTRACGACGVSCPSSSFFDMCIAPGLCEGQVNITQDGPTCAAACTTHLGAGARCTRAYGQGQTFGEQTPATCSTVPGTPTPNVTVTTTLVWCLCPGGGEPAPGQSCADRCGAQRCQNTQLRFDRGDDLFLGCTGPYQVHGRTVSTLRVGDVYSAPDTYDWVACRCEHPAR